MGIPRFARWITNKYKKMVVRGEAGPAEVAALYVDMNGLIHPCCHGNNPELAAAPEDEKLRRIAAALEDMVASTPPTTLLYLAVDGVAPRAKMNQQRARRYSAAVGRYGRLIEEEPSSAEQAAVDAELAQVEASLDRGASGGANEGEFGFDFAFLGETPPVTAARPPRQAVPPMPDPDAFDSNCISPGTQFMTRVAAHIRQYVSARLAAGEGPWHKELAVVLSDSNCPGEGEHKIIDFMRTHVCAGHLKNIPGAHVVVGLDADLLLLCMTLHRSNVFILRDNDRDRTFGAAPTQAVEPLTPEGSDEEAAASPSPGADVETVTTVISSRRRKLEFFDMSICADSIASEITTLAAMLLPADRATAVAAAPHRLVNDFIALASMLGNDFMPRLPSGHCGDGAMDNFVETYVRHVLPHGYLVNDGDVDLRMLRRWFAGYVPVEAAFFRQFMCKARDTADFATAGPFPQESDSVWIDAYRSSVNLSNDTARRAACGSFVDGLRFVWRYYSTTSAECSWRWFFPHYHAPLACDLLEFLQSCGPRPAIPTERVPPTPFTQLLCILPPTSCALLPKPYRAQMISPPPEAAASFPMQWSVDEAAAGGQDHLFTVLLPFADLDALQRVSEDGARELEPEERERNVNRDDYIVILNAENRHFSRRPDSDEVQYRWIRDGKETPAGSEGVVHIVTADPAPTGAVAKPRRYTLSQVKLLPVIPPEILDPPPGKRVRTIPNVRGLGLVDSGLLAAAAVLLVSTFSCALATTLQLACAMALAVGVMCLAGITEDLDMGSSQVRNFTRDTMLDWLCPDCHCTNFGRNECCFVCERPFDTQRCPALFSAAIPRNPPVMDPDHSKYMSSVGIEVPGWMAAEAKS